MNVKRLGNHIQGSPFKINVLDAEIGDASKVKIIGDALKQGKTQVANEFKIDTREAGKYFIVIIINLVKCNSTAQHSIICLLIWAVIMFVDI